MKLFKAILIFCSATILSSCSVQLQPVTIARHFPLEDYTYVYITPTSGLTSNRGSVYKGTGSTYSVSANPSEIIAGSIFKRGLIQVPEIKPELASKTLIVNYGESGRRTVWCGYTVEVTLQFLSAETHQVLCTATAEGFGSTEADDIRIAINRALSEIFPIK
ncbi:MAG: hypothetical protein E7147_02105 [Rikenellaceae bacterium]|nr:hypothetical protein [Rikenellaceae bacterium]